MIQAEVWQERAETAGGERDECQRRYEALQQQYDAARLQAANSAMIGEELVSKVHAMSRDIEALHAELSAAGYRNDSLQAEVVTLAKGAEHLRAALASSIAEQHRKARELAEVVEENQRLRRQIEAAHRRQSAGVPQAVTAAIVTMPCHAPKSGRMTSESDRASSRPAGFGAAGFGRTCD